MKGGGVMRVLGIEDPSIWGVYLLCILSAAFCLIYGMINWNKGDNEVRPEDVKWVDGEKEAEEGL